MIERGEFLKPHLWLIQFIGLIVPRRLRRDWRQEWEAEFHHREVLLAEWDRLDWHHKLDLLWRSTSAFWDALWLQPRRLEDEVFQDLRFAIRMLLKRPGFTLTAVLTLALGIGANTAIFSVVNSVLLRPLPYAEPERLMLLDETVSEQSRERFGVSYPNFLDWRAQQQSFEELAAWRETSLVLIGGDEPARLQATLVNAELFGLLRVAPAQGRLFLPADDEAGSPRVAVVSHGFWQRRFGGAPDLVGQTLTFSGIDATVVGVLPAGFQFPDDKTEVWLPLGLAAQQMTDRRVHICSVLGRLKPDVSQTQARTEIASIAARVQQAHPGDDAGHGGSVVSILDQLVGDVQQALWLLLGAVAFVLMVACANVANLLLARATVRTREMAIRLALGAGRERILRQLLTESLFLALLGGAAGLALAIWSRQLLAAKLAGLIPRANEIAIDGPVLGFTVLLTLLTGVVFGLAPAWQSVKLNLQGSLKEGGAHSQSSSAGGRRLRGALIVVEVALSLTLLIGAGLLLRSFQRVNEVDAGFRPENLLTLTISLPEGVARDPVQVVGFYQQLPERLKTVPGVEIVSATSRLPISGGDANGQLTIEGRDLPNDNAPAASFRRVLPNYFSAMGIPLKQGREFDSHEPTEGDKVVIVNESLARRFWPDGDALGKRVKVGPPEGEPWLTIVGVVGDVRNIGLESGPLFATYEPHAQRPRSTMNLVVRTTGDPASMAVPIRGALRALDKDLLVDSLSTMPQRLSSSLARRRVNLWLMSAFAGVALVLAAVGIFGVLSHEAAQRRHEIGVRLALGARHADVLRVLVGRGAKLALLGVALGAAASLALTRLLKSLLFEVSATDPLTFAGVALLLLVVALLACYLPARRAARVDPVVALRND